MHYIMGAFGVLSPTIFMIFVRKLLVLNMQVVYDQKCFILLDTEHFEGGNVVVQSKLGFYDLRQKLPTHLWREVSQPPNDGPIVPFIATRWL